MLSIIVFVLMVVSVAASGTVLATQDDAQNVEILSLPELETSDIIRVNSDADLATMTDGGSGTVADRYVIENKRIDAAGQGAGIYVRNTTKALIIRNCWVSNAVYVDSNWGPGANIMVYSEGRCIIENNRCDNTSGDGMKLSLTNSAISGNIIWGTQNGIVMVSATYCSIDNNTVTGSSWTGIGVIMASEFNTLSNNTLASCYNGIKLYAQGNDNLVRDNHITGGEKGIITEVGNRNDIRNNYIASASHGVEIDDSSGNLVRDNEMINNGAHIFFRRAVENTVTNNTCKGGASGVFFYDAPCNDNNITGNLFEGGTNFGVLMAPDGGGTHQRNTIINNTFLNIQYHGVWVNSGGHNNNGLVAKFKLTLCQCYIIEF